MLRKLANIYLTNSGYSNKSCRDESILNTTWMKIK